MYYQSTKSTDGSTNGFYKGLIASIEKSNPGYTWNFDENTLIGKKVGFIFREEEFYGQKGDVATATKPYQARSVDVIRAGVPVPEKKLVDRAGNPPIPTGFTQANEEPLPF